MSKRVLVIDDEEDIRTVAQVSLEMFGNWEVLTACCGAEGMEMAAREQPDAILMDVMMPDMDGPTTFQKMQQDEAIRGIPVILLTAKVQGPDRKKFLDLGVSGVLAKPFDPTTLATEVAAVLGW